jgi:hypothetical protein
MFHENPRRSGAGDGSLWLCDTQGMGRKPGVIDATYRVVRSAIPHPWWAWGEAPGGGAKQLIRIVGKSLILIGLVLAVKFFADML